MSQARRSYEDNHQLMGLLVSKLVAKHNQLKANAEPHWGHVGDLDYLNEKLAEALQFSPADITELATELGMDFA